MGARLVKDSTRRTSVTAEPKRMSLGLRTLAAASLTANGRCPTGNLPYGLRAESKTMTNVQCVLQCDGVTYLEPVTLQDLAATSRIMGIMKGVSRERYTTFSPREHGSWLQVSPTSVLPAISSAKSLMAAPVFTTPSGSTWMYITSLALASKMFFP